MFLPEGVQCWEQLHVKSIVIKKRLHPQSFTRYVNLSILGPSLRRLCVPSSNICAAGSPTLRAVPPAFALPPGFRAGFL